MAEKSNSTSWYDDLDWIVKLILTIIPFTGWILGAIVRILRGNDQKDNTKLIAGIVYLVTGACFGIGWIVDVVTMVMNKDITILA